ncbi:hypothetical protein [Labedella gwakjiensis]|uniref:hypothetical protein n=1 Tax=Labedella gwakjiensis TaxID=390269 RepID=UPI000F8E069E|nr:hypothetical protein [Labedella gwakjiensis]
MLASLAAIGLTGCSVADEPTHRAEPTATADIAAQLGALETRIDRILWSRPSPSSLWYQLDPSNDIGRVVLASDAGAATAAPYAFAHDAGDDLLTFDVFVSALTRAGGPLSADATHAYLCAAYSVDTYDQDVTRTTAECPADLVPDGSALVSLDDLDPAA